MQLQLLRAIAPFSGRVVSSQSSEVVHLFLLLLVNMHGSGWLSAAGSNSSRRCTAQWRTQAALHECMHAWAAAVLRVRPLCGV